MNTEQINWLLILAGIIAVYYTAKGGSDGFIRTIFEMFSVLAAALAAALAAPYINSILKIEAPLFSFLIGYVVFWLGLKYACAALDLISKLPIINELNKAAGVLTGLFRGIFMIWILLIVITVFQNTTWGQAAMEMVAQSSILEKLYDSNLILRLAKVFF